ncbi:hypothetical protein [Amycolatopsis sp. NPDC102389]|uniref:hypothetical protein n=1 Tax=Amycolatopsis sp. NPDC102389 TaxID=3363941 RepID=UPI0037FE7ED4
MYCLQAVIVTESARSRLPDSAGGTRLVPLGQNLWLMPVTEAGFDNGLLAESSEQGAVAYVEAEALRRLGVLKGDHFDEFDAVGLGRHRNNDDWLSA